MMEEDLNITWSSYSAHLKQMLEDLITSQSFTDVTLVCDDKVQLEAHKIILTSSSTFFRHIFKSSAISGEAKPIIYLKGINHEDMKPILNFIYLGEARFSQERTNQFLKVAQDLELTAISNLETGTSIHENLLTDSVNSSEFRVEEGSFTENEDLELIEQKEQNLENKIDSMALMSNTREKPDIIEDEVQTTINNFAENNKFKCNKCNDLFSSKSYLKTHCIKTHNANGVTNICRWCGFQAENKPELKCHKKEVHNYKSCTKCDFIAEYRPKVLIHYNKTHRKIGQDSNDKNISMRCEQCDFKASRTEALEEHIESIHITQATMQCKNCKHSYSSDFLLKKHEIAKHSGKEYEYYYGKITENGERSYFCTECDYQNHYTTSIRRHIKSVHLDIKYYCDQCDYSATNMGNLNIHTNFVHKSIKKFCHICDKTFKTDGSLQCHVNSKHLGVKLHCTLCNSEIGRYGNLRKHMKKCHL